MRARSARGSATARKGKNSPAGAILCRNGAEEKLNRKGGRITLPLFLCFSVRFQLVRERVIASAPCAPYGDGTETHFGKGVSRHGGARIGSEHAVDGMLRQNTTVRFRQAGPVSGYFPAAKKFFMMEKAGGEGRVQVCPGAWHDGGTRMPGIFF